MLETHGGLNLLELADAGIEPASVMDFSANVNPFGPSPHTLAALRRVDPGSYPDPEARALRLALAAANSSTPENVLVGNGTADLIWLAAHSLLKPGDPLLIVGPTFGEYERSARAVGGRLSHFTARAPDFQIDIDHLTWTIRDLRPRLTFLCNPNNPTGQHLVDADVQRVATACGRGWLILDEAYRGFVSDSPFGPPPRPNVIVLRSMTKDFALPGLRLGYAVAASKPLERMRAFQPPWSVNAAAQAAGLACMNDLKHLWRTLDMTTQSAGMLRAGLTRTGARVVTAPTHFLLVEVGDGGTWRERLMAEGCLVRDCASFGLPQFVRVGTRRAEENDTLVRAWKRLT